MQIFIFSCGVICGAVVVYLIFKAIYLHVDMEQAIDRVIKEKFNG